MPPCPELKKGSIVTTKVYAQCLNVCSHTIIFELRQNLELEKIIVHGDYNPETTEHDVALLKLRQAVDLAVRRVLTIFLSLLIIVKKNS